MNLVLFSTDELSGDVVRLTGRRAGHIRTVHRAAVGDELTIGVINGRIGRGTVLSLDPLEMRVALDREPPAPVAVTLVLALPRPKVMNRVIAAATSMGVKRIFIINAWRVEKSYWKSPRLSPDNLHAQILAGLEQAVDTVMPVIEMRRLFRPFVENELASIAAGSRAIVAHPRGAGECPHVAGPVTLAIGPEGGFIDQEIASFTRIGFEAVSLGPRILRV
ncbi:MAG: 16S rRNA (uracil(1498)-N(3))-methyltransferase, partial [Thermoanaerobaculia bacterium]